MGKLGLVRKTTCPICKVARKGAGLKYCVECTLIMKRAKKRRQSKKLGINAFETDLQIDVAHLWRALRIGPIGAIERKIMMS